MSKISGLRGPAVAIILASLVAGLGVVALTSPALATAVSNCAALRRPVHLFYNKAHRASVLTSDSKRYPALKKAGYADLGVLFKASGKKNGLAAVHEMYNSKTYDRIYTRSATEMAGINRKGYVDRGIAFYAYPKSGSCLYPVYRFRKGPMHLYVGSSSDRAWAKKNGWIEQSKVYWLSRPASLIHPTTLNPPVTSRPPSSVPTPTRNAFTVAVMPDTQNETLSATDSRFVNRTKWLVANRAKLNLRFVTHVGDVVNWDTPDHVEYQRAHDALAVLNANDVPYSLSPGNHDTGAVCVGGSACPGKNIPVAVRDTRTFNTYLSGGVADVRGYFEAGKVDNTYSTFDASGREWLVLNLELWPRKAVIEWAKTVVSSHPHATVMVVTHSYLTSDGKIYQKSDYGSTSPQYLFDHLISKYPNIRLVFSGHVGTAAHRIDKGASGNRIDSFLLCIHSAGGTNPVRLVQIDPSNGLLKTWVYSPAKPSQNYSAYAYAVGGIDWVR